MAACPLSLIDKLINRIAPSGLTADEKAVRGRNDAKIKSMKKTLSKNLQGSSKVNQARAEQLFHFLEAEEARLGMLKKSKYTREDLQDLKKPILPVAAVNLVHELAVNDEVDEMKLLKWQLYRVSYVKKHGGETVFEEKSGDLKDYVIHGFSSKVYIDFGTNDEFPICVINMQFQPFEEVRLPAVVSLPAYSNDQMPPRYSVNEKSTTMEAGATVVDEKKNFDSTPPGPKGWCHDTPYKTGAQLFIRGLLGRKISFESRPVKFDRDPFEMSGLPWYEGKQTFI